jgi:hypothetical protein
MKNKNIPIKKYSFYFIMFLILESFFVFTGNSSAQDVKLVKILVTTPHVEEKNYEPFADVVSGCIIRELKRNGGIEMLSREKADEYMKGKGGNGSVSTREEAIDVGAALGADVVIYTALIRVYDVFKYSIQFYEVKKDIIQRTYFGSFKHTDSANLIAREIKKQVEQMIPYIPMPSELNDPGLLVRDNTIDPDKPPVSHEIENFPQLSSYGLMEQILSYYRVFPGEQEYEKFDKGTRVMRFRFRQGDLDEEMDSRLNKFYVYGDFAIRQNMQAYLVKSCSSLALNILIANDIPVFYKDDVILSYNGLSADGYCYFKTFFRMVYDSTEITPRDRSFVLIILPKPGKKGGISKEYLDSALGRYKNEEGEAPELVEITEGLLDLQK